MMGVQRNFNQKDLHETGKCGILTDMYNFCEWLKNYLLQLLITVNSLYEGNHWERHNVSILTLYTPRSTYKFSRLISIHFF